jgi:hypothetical protein
MPPYAASPGDRLVNVELHDTGPSWTLLSVACAAGRCAQLARTDDHGRTWQRLPVTTIGTGDWGASCPPACPVHRLHFVSPTVGYLYAPGLQVTLDGGRTWHDQQPPAAVEGLAEAGGVVARVTGGWCQKSADDCRPALSWSMPGSSTWRPTALPANPPREYASAYSSGSGPAYILFGDNMAGGVIDQPIILRSTDGRSWTALPDPCAGDGKEAIDLASSGQRLTVLCMQHGGQAATDVRQSADGGDTFGSPSRTKVAWAGDLAQTSGDLLVGTGPISGGDDTTLQLDRLDGTEWRGVGKAVVNGDVAWLVSTSSLWFSRDNGKTWTVTRTQDLGRR